MELRFSQGAELPFPHQKMSGTGTDSLGAWELRAGRRYMCACMHVGTGTDSLGAWELRAGRR